MTKAGAGDQNASPRWLLPAGLLVAYSPSYINVALRGLGVDWHFIRGPQSALLWNWLAVGVLLVFILRAERQGVGSIGLRRPSRADLQWALAFWGISTAVSAILSSIWPPPPSSGMALVLAMPLPALIALIITTAVTEEILFRGYPVERLGRLTGSIWLGAALSLGLFVLPHLNFFGPQWLLYQGAAAVMAYVLYVWRRNLFACMLMHFLGNATLLIPALGLADPP